MTAVLRSIGDDETVAPDSYEGLMPWSAREQVRFVAALDAGEVVSAATSAYLVETMRPIKAHRWGLGTVGATTFKGGWLRQGRVTRQLGLLDSYAVAIITDQGPVVRQTDGDSAHVRAMDDLAELLAARLAWERECRRGERRPASHLRDRARLQPRAQARVPGDDQTEDPGHRHTTGQDPHHAGGVASQQGGIRNMNAAAAPRATPYVTPRASLAPRPGTAAGSTPCTRPRPAKTLDRL